MCFARLFVCAPHVQMMRNNLQRYNIFSRYANNVLIYGRMCKGGGLINRKIYLLMSKNYRSVIVFSHLRGSPCRILRNPQTVFSVYAAACVARANRNTPRPRFAARIPTPPLRAPYQSAQTNAFRPKRQRNTTHPTPFPNVNNRFPSQATL